jgi:hypothetical protein
MTPTQLEKIKGEFFKEFGAGDTQKCAELNEWDMDACPFHVWQFIESKLEKVEKECDKQCEENLAKLLAQFNGMMMEDEVRDRNGKPVMFYPPKLRDFKSNKLGGKDGRF